MPQESRSETMDYVSECLIDLVTAKTCDYLGEGGG